MKRRQLLMGDFDVNFDAITIATKWQLRRCVTKIALSSTIKKLNKKKEKKKI